MQKLVTQTERPGLISGMLSVEVKHYCPSHGLCLKDSVMSLTGLLVQASDDIGHTRLLSNNSF